MIRPALSLLCLLAAPALANGTPPTAAAIRKVVDANRPSLVRVDGPHRHGTGVVVGAAGQILTSTQFTGLDSAQVRLESPPREARVVMANASLRVAMLELREAADLRAAAVCLDGAPERGTWLVVMGLGDRGVSAQLSRVSHPATELAPTLQLNVSFPVGSAVFDARGRLVALVVRQLEKSSRALLISAVKQELAQQAHR